MKVTISKHNGPEPPNLSRLETGYSGKEPIVELFLDVHSADTDAIYLRGTDRNGQNWFILKVTPTGIEMNSGIDANSGFPLMRGSIKRGVFKIKG